MIFLPIILTSTITDSFSKQQMVDAFVDCIECIYHHGDRTGPRSIIMGLFPPARADAAQQYDNDTSREIAKIKGNNDWDWNDLAPYSPNGLAKDFDDICMACKGDERSYSLS